MVEQYIRTYGMNNIVNHETLLELGLTDKEIVTDWLVIICKLHKNIAERNYHKSVVSKKGAQKNRDVEFDYNENKRESLSLIREMRKLTVRLNILAQKSNLPDVIANVQNMHNKDFAAMLYRYSNKYIKGE